MNEHAVVEDAEALRELLATAVDRMLDAAARVRVQAVRLKAAHPSEAGELDDAVAAIREACGFQDLAGQLLTRMVEGRNADPLLAGPAAFGGGVSQADVDALMA